MGSRSARTIGHLVLGNDLQQLHDELFLLIPGAGLCDSDAEMLHGVHGAFETKPLHGHVINGPRLGHQAANEVVSDEETFPVPSAPSWDFYSAALPCAWRF